MNNTASYWIPNIPGSVPIRPLWVPFIFPFPFIFLDLLLTSQVAFSRTQMQTIITVVAAHYSSCIGLN